MGFNINIDNKFRVTTDNRQYIVDTYSLKDGELQYDKKGEVKVTNSGRKYCGSFKSLLQIISEEGLRMSTVNSIEELVLAHKEIANYIADIHEVVNEKFKNLETLDNLNNLVITETEGED